MYFHAVRLRVRVPLLRHGYHGLKRNLTADEITDQLLHFHLNGHTLDSVSFMGMGEALANPHLFGLGHRRITISTIGLLPGIDRLTREFPQVNLTFSMHSPFDDQRSELMPINKRFPLRDVLNELDHHIRQTGRKVYIAYIFLQGFNDSTEHAKAVASLLRGRGSWEHLYHVNLIPYNSTEVTSQSYLPSDPERIKTFVRTLIRSEHNSDRTLMRHVVSYTELNSRCSKCNIQYSVCALN